MPGNPNLKGTAKRIQVVEDDEPTRELLRYQLESAKYSVTTAADGVQALELLRQESYDLVLLDVWMPEMTGPELLAHLRTESIRAKVIVMASDKSPDTVLQSVREQAYQYITKPVPRDELENLVNEALASPTVGSTNPHGLDVDKLCVYSGSLGNFKGSTSKCFLLTSVFPIGRPGLLREVHAAQWYNPCGEGSADWWAGIITPVSPTQVNTSSSGAFPV